MVVSHCFGIRISGSSVILFKDKNIWLLCHVVLGFVRIPGGCVTLFWDKDICWLSCCFRIRIPGG